MHVSHYHHIDYITSIIMKGKREEEWIIIFHTDLDK